MLEIHKNRVRWRNKILWWLDHQARIVERRFTKIRIYYWEYRNDDPHPVQPTLRIGEHRWKYRWKWWEHQSLRYREDSWKSPVEVWSNDCTIIKKTLRDDEKPLYVEYKFKGTRNKFSTYGHKSINSTEKNKTNTARTARNMGTWFNNNNTRTKKTSTAHTARKMVTQLRNVILRRIMRNNIPTVTRRITKKRTSGIKKNMTRKK